jgi:Domain of Unknown Function (DUF928)
MSILKLLTRSVVVGLTLSIAFPASAAYKPRNRRPPTTRITHTATRDTCNGQDILVTPIAPQDHVAEFGQTPKTPLTLAWSVSERGAKPTATPTASRKLNLKVDIYRMGQTQSFLTTAPATQIANGRWQASLSEPLPIGQYAWKLTNDCGQSVTNLTALQEFEVSALPLSVERAITAAKTPIQRSAIYAESGFWYNALDEALRSDTPQALTDLQNFAETDIKPQPCP